MNLSLFQNIEITEQIYSKKILRHFRYSDIKILLGEPMANHSVTVKYKSMLKYISCAAIQQHPSNISKQDHIVWAKFFYSTIIIRQRTSPDDYLKQNNSNIGWRCRVSTETPSFYTEDWHFRYTLSAKLNIRELPKSRKNCLNTFSSVATALLNFAFNSEIKPNTIQNNKFPLEIRNSSESVLQ